MMQTQAENPTRDDEMSVAAALRLLPCVSTLSSGLTELEASLDGFSATLYSLNAISAEDLERIRLTWMLAIERQARVVARHRHEFGTIDAELTKIAGLPC